MGSDPNARWMSVLSTPYLSDYEVPWPEMLSSFRTAGGVTLVTSQHYLSLFIPHYHQPTPSSRHMKGGALTHTNTPPHVHVHLLCILAAACCWSIPSFTLCLVKSYSPLRTQEIFSGKLFLKLLDWIKRLPQDHPCIASLTHHSLTI